MCAETVESLNRHKKLALWVQHEKFIIGVQKGCDKYLARYKFCQTMTSSHTGRSNSSRKEKGQLDTGMSLGGSANAFIEINMSTNGANKSGSQPHRNRTAIDADNDAKESAGDLLELNIKEVFAKLGKITMETENHRNAIVVMRSRSTSKSYKPQYG